METISNMTKQVLNEIRLARQALELRDDQDGRKKRLMHATSR